jgi:hypothetical protein
MGKGKYMKPKWTPEELNVAQNHRQVDSTGLAHMYRIKFSVQVYDVEWNGIGYLHRIVRISDPTNLFNQIKGTLRELVMFAASRISAWRRGKGGYKEGEGGRKLQEVRAMENQKADSLGEGRGELPNNGCGGGSGRQ